MELENLDALLTKIENPRAHSKAQREEARHILLENSPSVLPELHLRLRQWIDDFNSPEAKGIDERCRVETRELRDRLGGPDHPAFIAKWDALPGVRAREALRDREAAAMAVIELVGEIGHPDSIPVLKDVLTGPWQNDMTWFTAAAALIRLGDPAGTAYMKERILDETTTPGLRRGCCRTLCEWGVSGVFEPEEALPGDPAQAAALEEEFVRNLRRG